MNSTNTSQCQLYVHSYTSNLLAGLGLVLDLQSVFVDLRRSVIGRNVKHSESSVILQDLREVVVCSPRFPLQQCCIVRSRRKYLSTSALLHERLKSHRAIFARRLKHCLPLGRLTFCMFNQKLSNLVFFYFVLRHVNHWRPLNQEMIFISYKLFIKSCII